MKESEISYIAGLFDGEGSIHSKRGPEKNKKHKDKPGYRMSNSMRISMEVTMTDPMVIHWLKETLKTGTVTKKPRKGLRKDGTKYLMQYRWRCTFRDAYYVCCLIYPKNKKPKWDGKSRVSNDLYRKNFNEIFGKKEQDELNESYQQSLKNKKDREK